jgi:hypothetical protein
MKRLLIALLIAAPVAHAQTIAATARGIVVAHDGAIELFDRTGRTLLWRTAGVATPAAIVASDTRIAVLDPLANEARIVSLEDGRAVRVKTAETPIGGVFSGSALYVVDRDARTLERIAADGTRTALATGADPGAIRESGARVYVYCRAEGALDEYTTAPFARRRSVHVAPFASDFELDAQNAYFVLPRGSKIEVVALASMQPAGSIDVGAVPVSFAFTSTGSALTARTLAVADPSAKKVWMIEGAQSFTQAFTRGFLRGLIGLGLFGGGASQFPTGVDRVITSGNRWYAYDSSSGTLYRFSSDGTAVVATKIGASQFAVTAGGVFVWNDAVRRLQKAD